MTPKVEKVERVIHETGVGVEDRTEVVYELVDTIDGARVVFSSVPAATVEAAKPADEPAAA